MFCLNKIPTNAKTYYTYRFISLAEALLETITHSVPSAASPSAQHRLGSCLHRALRRLSTDSQRCWRQPFDRGPLSLTHVAIMATIQDIHSLHYPVDKIATQVKLQQFMMTSWHGNVFRSKWPFLGWICRSPVDSPQKGRWTRALDAYCVVSLKKNCQPTFESPVS